MEDRNKGKSVVTELSDFIVIDLETTGLDPEFDEIIEMGAIKVRDGKMADTFQQLIKPSEPIDEFISNLTGITNEMLSAAPKVTDVIGQYIEFISDDVVLGHNVGFDINFVYDCAKECIGKEFSNDYVDTMRMARRILPDLEHHRLIDLMKHYGVDADTSHRSLADCETTLEVYRHLLEEVKKRGVHLEDVFVSHHNQHKLKAADILAMTEPDENSPIYGKMVVFTGTLERMARKDAMQIVANLGGVNGDSVTKKTNFLVLGNEDYANGKKNGKSNKYKKAEELIEKGADLQIISEDVFFDLVEN